MPRLLHEGAIGERKRAPGLADLPRSDFLANGCPCQSFWVAVNPPPPSPSPSPCPASPCHLADFRPDACEELLVAFCTASSGVAPEATRKAAATAPAPRCRNPGERRLRNLDQSSPSFFWVDTLQTPPPKKKKHGSYWVGLFCLGGALIFGRSRGNQKENHKCPLKPTREKPWLLRAPGRCARTCRLGLFASKNKCVQPTST